MRKLIIGLRQKEAAASEIPAADSLLKSIRSYSESLEAELKRNNEQLSETLCAKPTESDSSEDSSELDAILSQVKERLLTFVSAQKQRHVDRVNKSSQEALRQTYDNLLSQSAAFCTRILACAEEQQQHATAVATEAAAELRIELLLNNNSKVMQIKNEAALASLARQKDKLSAAKRLDKWRCFNFYDRLIHNKDCTIVSLPGSGHFLLVSQAHLRTLFSLVDGHDGRVLRCVMDSSYYANQYFKVTSYKSAVIVISKEVRKNGKKKIEE